MPLLVDAVLRSSPIHGLGLFAPAPVAAGTPVWQFDDRVDRIIPEDPELLALYPVLARLATEHVCAVEDGLLIFGDDSRFMNHSDQPNVEPVTPGDYRRFRARRDIAAGEELTCNYEDICGAVREQGAATYLAAQPRP
ncbi:SET domain-containing protein [Paracraurococcus lichenis]|uniref:SET domain-containing protein n=1 Tax=Paracraurococcus lichenis TaxID=3064888 RepID=A0ABT9E987_9PROT|nr:SET domain-containing protein [Paracraurococcus sp. LOR1-02]MDO9712729.1 SET domain-containing protein [Paracraurococcus sp. LOR1-02]